MKIKMNSRAMRILVAALVICVVTCTMLSNAVLAVNDAVTACSNGVLQVKLNYTDDNNNDITVNGGTAFLINDNTLLTCYHVISLSTDDIDLLAATYGKSATEIQSRLSVAITVTRDMKVPATILNYSEEMDFAILRLTSTMQGKTPLKIRSSSEVRQLDPVYAIGFPDTSAMLQSYNTYTSKDATITNGVVNKIATGINLFSGANTDYIQTSCNLDYGNSGGPMVDENGAVIGISQGTVGDSATEYFNAIAIDQVTEALSTLGVAFTRYESEPEIPDEPDEPTEPITTDPPATQATLPTLPSISEEPEPEEGMSGTTLILIIAAVAVVLIVVVVVIIMVTGKKNKPTPPSASFAPPDPVGAFSGVSTMGSGFGSVPTIPIAGVGETTVLTSGAGETTVLSRNAVNGGTLIRKRTGDTVSINSDNFVIGRERKNVNFCINDNNSVSRTHVRLTVRGGVTYLSDLNTANGTFVNGVKVMPHQEVALKNGDKLTLADEELEYRN